jgi:hypothetical protein
MTGISYDVQGGGWFAWWESNGKRVETLRTKWKEKAERWSIQGRCHGSSKHYLPCPFCEGKDYE